VIATLLPHFQNPSVLSDLSYRSILCFRGLFSLTALTAILGAAAMFAGVLSEYRGALNQDQRKCIDAANAWDEQIRGANVGVLIRCIW